jgi:probable phosphoglycerate mutase
MTPTSRYFIARHGETVFNAAGRMQGDALHTPLTRAGFAQAEEMGRALRERLGARPNLTLWTSDAGRAQQTMAVIAEHLELDWHNLRADPRLAEIGIGAWSGHYYRDLIAENEALLDRSTGLFGIRAPGGEIYEEVAARLGSWLDAQAHEPGDRLVVMHGMSSRVLRGIMTDAPARTECGAPVADGLPQGSVVEIKDGVETVMHLGGGGSAAL